MLILLSFNFPEFLCFILSLSDCPFDCTRVYFCCLFAQMVHILAFYSVLFILTLFFSIHALGTNESAGRVNLTMMLEYMYILLGIL